MNVNYKKRQNIRFSHILLFQLKQTTFSIARGTIYVTRRGTRGCFSCQFGTVRICVIISTSVHYSLQ